jgi:H+/Cl- antiporter ClcA
MKTIILRFIFIAVILMGMMFMGAEPADGGSVLPSMFIGGCCMLFAWGMWENNECLRNWK